MNRPRSLLLALALPVLLALAPGAQAQGATSSLILVGGKGAKVLSVVSIPVHPQGQLVVTFHGDAAAGLA